MRSWKEVRPGQLVCVGTTCDRCGQNAKPFNSDGAFGEVSVYVQGEGRDRYEADLCADCAGELVTWTRERGGRGVVSPGQVQRDMSNAEPYKTIYEEVAETMPELPPAVVVKVVEMARKRGAR